MFDVLAPAGLAATTSVLTDPPARTVQAPGATQALARSALHQVEVTDTLHGQSWRGRARCLDQLGALVAKAQATTLAVRDNPERDWQDAALLLAMIEDPLNLAAQLTRKDRTRLRRLTPLLDRNHIGWAVLSSTDYREGTATMRFLLDP